MTPQELRENALMGLQQYQNEIIQAMRRRDFERVATCVNICRALSDIAYQSPRLPSALFQEKP